MCPKIKNKQPIKKCWHVVFIILGLVESHFVHNVFELFGIEVFEAGWWCQALLAEGRMMPRGYSVLPLKNDDPSLKYYLKTNR